jgi:hypothetical protein
VMAAEPFAAAFPTRHVLATGSSEESLASCRRLAALGQGRCAVVERAVGIPEGVNRCLAA